MSSKSSNRGSPIWLVLFLILLSYAIGDFLFALRDKREEFSLDTKQACLLRASGRDEITGEPLRDDYQYHHIRPISYGGKGVLSNCVVINLDTHNALHEIMSNGRFSLRRYYDKIHRLSPAQLVRVTQYLLDIGWRFADGWWYHPW